MMLPNARETLVDRTKIVDYLLSPTHPQGRGKTRFFYSLGFRPERWRELAEALRRQGAEHPVVEVAESVYGSRYVVDGALRSPDGRNPPVRTVWILDRGAEVPRLVTAYPIRS